MMKAILFDFGNTLASSGLPLNWQEFYRESLIKILDGLGINANLQKLQAGEQVLLRYNTRVNPREYEVGSDLIFYDLFREWDITDLTGIDKAKDHFYSFFLGRTELYPDTIPLLKELRKRNLKTGVLTDTAYGADKEYLISGASDIVQYIDVFLASTEVGLRKPNTKGYLRLSQELNTTPADCIFVGDEEKDITGANKAGMISVLLDRNSSGADYGQQYAINSLKEILNLA
jgi:putative hydrolase of the HAD superfamily